MGWGGLLHEVIQGPSFVLPCCSEVFSSCKGRKHHNCFVACGQGQWDTRKCKAVSFEDVTRKLQVLLPVPSSGAERGAEAAHICMGSMACRLRGGSVLAPTWGFCS